MLSNEKTKVVGKMSTTVAKFGGTSLCDASQFMQVKRIIDSDPSRRIIVASAPGKRFGEDVKVTDLLLDCYAAAVHGEHHTTLFLI